MTELVDLATGHAAVIGFPIAGLLGSIWRARRLADPDASWFGQFGVAVIVGPLFAVAGLVVGVAVTVGLIAVGVPAN